MNFETWYKELTSDERWLETMQMQHKGKDIKEAALIVYGDAVSDPEAFKHRPITEHRRHVHYKLFKMPVRVERVVQTHQAEEKKEVAEIPQMSDEEINKRLEEWKESIAQVTFRPVPRLSHEEILEEGQWLPKAKEHYRTDEGTVNEWKQKMRRCQEMTLRERHPDWSEEQIASRLKEIEP